MSNLITTIISYVLIAVAAVMGIFYGGTAYENAQINAVANAIMNESQQILYAERMWSTNRGQPDISGMGTPCTAGVGTSALVNGKELAEWPALGGTMGTDSTLTHPGPQPYISCSGAATVTTGTHDSGCYSINGYSGYFHRTITSYMNGNYVYYEFVVSVPNNTCTPTGNWISYPADLTNVNHPIVKIAKAINSALNQIPANANMAAMPYIGLPQPPAGATAGNTTPLIYDPSQNTGMGMPRVFLDSNGTLQSNYCYISANQWITCVFGPS